MFDPALLQFGPYTARRAPWPGLGLVIDGLDALAPPAAIPVSASAGAAPPVPADYVDDVLLTPAYADQFFRLVDAVGLVVCKNVADGTRHRDVRGRSSRGRLSQGEFYHHDGCSGPTKPRVVEIRCPYQDIARHTPTAIAPFPDVLVAMLLELRADLRSTGDLLAWHTALTAGRGLPDIDLDELQGTINRAIRRALDAEALRAYFRRVDLRANAYREPWTMGESRFISNATYDRTVPDKRRTMQHRRAYLDDPVAGRPNGRLLKRWPADPDLEEAHD